MKTMNEYGKIGIVVSAQRERYQVLIEETMMYARLKAGSFYINSNEVELQSGDLSQKRWETYLNLQREDKYAKQRAEQFARQQMKKKTKYTKQDREYSKQIAY